ncbi:MAG TPA: anti-sigma factor, partial [Longimicrobium sp.]|nr:anti-sigma factor [Longimicrobium sp.]
IPAPRPAPAVAPVPPATAAEVVPIDRARRTRTRAGGVGWMAAAASLALLIATGAYAWSLRGRYDALAERVTALERERVALLQTLGERDQRLAAVSDPGVQVIDLASNDARAPSGRMFWNVATHRWTFFAHNLPALKPGRDYQLWLVTPEGPVGAGTFKSDRGGHAMVEATYPLPPERLRAIAVTEEPEGGLPKPSGTPLIVGTYGSSE